MQKTSFTYRIINIAICLLLLILLVPGRLQAQDKAEEERKGPAFDEMEQIFDALAVSGGMTEALIEISVIRWGESPDAELDGQQKFSVSIAAQPSFLTNVKILEGSQLAFTENETRKTLRLQFDTAAREASGGGEEKADLLLVIKAENGNVVPGERRLVIPLTYHPLAVANIQICVQKEGLEERPAPETAHQSCDDTIEDFFIYDDLWLFFTPERDLSKAFRWRILHESGEEVFGGIFDPDNEKLNNTKSAGEGAPGKFIFQLGTLWDNSKLIRGGPDESPVTPAENISHGKYTLETCEPELETGGVFGQASGWSKTCREDWQHEDSFNVQAAILHFQGFGTEKGLLPFGQTGKFRIETKEVREEQAVLVLRAEWENFRNDSLERAENGAEYAGIIRASRGEKRDDLYRNSGEVTQVENGVVWWWDGPTCAACRRPSIKVGPETRWDEEGDFSSLGAVKSAVDAGESVIVKEVKTAASQVTLRFPKVFDPQIEIMGEISAAITTTDPDHIFSTELNALVPSATVPPDRGMVLAPTVGEHYFGAVHPPGIDKPEEHYYVRSMKSDGRLNGPEAAKNFHLHHKFKNILVGSPKGPFSRHIRDEAQHWYLPVWFAADQQTRLAGFAVYGRQPEIYAGPWPYAPGSVDDEYTPGTDNKENTQTGEGIESTGTGTDTDRDRADGAIDPDRLNPNKPAVADHIRQWTSVARPPENAVPGSNWSYDKFGRVVGSGPGLRTVSTHDSVEYGGGTPEASAWSLRTKLDSIDHCTLEEYVVAKLSLQSIDQCAGRYGAIRDLKGVKLSEAKSTVDSKGFTYTLAPGLPAKTEEENGTVEKQDPGPMQYLKKGAAIKLYIHSPYVAQTPELPDFIGKSLTNAKEWLQENNLPLKLKPGSPAPAENLSGAVESQEPEPGTKIAAGGTVTLTVHSNFVDVRLVPDVLQLSFTDARQRLESAGLVIDRQDGGKAPNQVLAGMAKQQEPQAGSKVDAGQGVRVWFYGEYSPSRDERVASYDCSQILDSYAAWDSSANAPRCFCPQGFTLDMGKTRCVSLEAANQEVCESKWPNSSTVAVWNSSSNVYECGCPNGLEWDLNSRFCISIAEKNQLICERDRPGSIPGGLGSDGVYICNCPSGLAWDSSGTRCIALQAANQEICESKWPNSSTVAVWNPGKNEYECGCPSGLEWDLNSRFCISIAEKNRLICERDRPGSIPGGLGSDGVYICNCPSGLAWDSSGTRCVQASQQNNNNQNGQDCDLKIWQIEMLMGTYNMDMMNNTLSKQMAEGLALVARNAGCDQSRINQALGSGGGGTDHQGECPPGMIMGTKPGSWGQEEDCVPAGTTNNQRQPPGSCNDPGMTVVHKLIDPPPYAGVSRICRDSSGGLWFQTPNRLIAIINLRKGPQNRNTGCYDDSQIQTSVRNYGGRLCGP